MLYYAKPNAVELSVLVDVAGCKGLKAVNILHIWTVVWKLWNKPAVSASVAEATTYFNVLHSIWIGSLKWVHGGVFLLYSWPQLK